MTLIEKLGELSFLELRDGRLHSEMGEDVTDELLSVLEQPAQQEPFGYFRYDLRLDAWVQNREGRPGTPFYTFPQPRKPLTEDKLADIAMQTGAYDGQLLVFARAIEAAHKIGVEK